VVLSPVLGLNGHCGVAPPMAGVERSTDLGGDLALNVSPNTGELTLPARSGRRGFCHKAVGQRVGE
jgi:hypothetical protein